MENPDIEDEWDFFRFTVLDGLYDGLSSEEMQHVIAENSILDPLQIDRERFMEIIASAFQEHIDPVVIRALIEHDPGVAHVQEEDGLRWFLLHYACHYYAPLQVTQLLIELNPNAVYVKGSDGKLPLHIAIDDMAASFETIQLLLSHYPEAARETDNKGHLPLHDALDDYAIQLLLDTYPDAARALNSRGMLPLHLCISRCSEQALQTLMDHYDGDEADHKGLAVRDVMGRTPLHHAAEYCFMADELETFRFLVDSFPEALRTADFTGKLPLHYACARYGIGASLEHTRLLLDIDLFSILKVTHDGLSALEYSFENDDNRRPKPLEVRQFLLEKQDEALQLMHDSFHPTAVHFNLPADLVIGEIWSFVLPHLWRPTEDEMNGA